MPSYLKYFALSLLGSVLVGNNSYALNPTISFDVELHQEGDQTARTTEYYLIPTIHCSPYASYLSGEDTSLVISGGWRVNLPKGQSVARATSYTVYDNFTDFAAALSDTDAHGKSSIVVPGYYTVDDKVLPYGTTWYQFALHANGLGFGSEPLVIDPTLHQRPQGANPRLTWTGPASDYASISVSVYNAATNEFQSANLAADQTSWTPPNALGVGQWYFRVTYIGFNHGTLQTSAATYYAGIIGEVTQGHWVTLDGWNGIAGVSLINSNFVSFNVAAARLFIAQAGAFAGRVGNTGSITLNLRASGVFTGTLIAGGRSYPLRGSLDQAGKFVSATSPALSLDLNVHGTAESVGDIAINGVANGEAFTAYHAAYGVGTTAPEMGKYTVLFKPVGATPIVPQGIGYASINVSKTGSAMYSGGKLADGTSLTGGATLVGNGSGGRQVIFHNTSLYATRGHLVGAIAFANAHASDCTGLFHWFKPLMKTGAYYPQGFDTTLTLSGARYVVVRNAAAVPFAGGVAQASLKDNGLNAAIAKSITLAVTNVVTVNSSNDEGLVLKFVPSAGTFSGSFHHPANPKVLTKISGVLFQNANSPEAAGFYLSPIVAGSGLSGIVDLSP